jgi:predicted amidohydrolase/GNAT superfamily N-acetyltransferase
MLPRTFETKSGTVTLRLARAEDVDTLIRLNKRCFPTMPEENVQWNSAQLHNHQRLFPEGQLVVEREGVVVGAVATLIVRLGLDDYRQHTYAGITDGGFFHNHDPQGDTLYGADVYVDPDLRRSGVGHVLYEGRRELCKKLNLRRILAGGRIDGYSAQAESQSPEDYVAKVEAGELRDPVLSFQLKEGFVVRGVIRNYIRDPKSRNCATLIEWLNPDHKRADRAQLGKVRVASVQYQVRRIESFEEFAEGIEYFVETAFGYRADFVVFPEFTTMQLLSQRELRNMPALEGIESLATMTERVLDLYVGLAKRYGINIVAGTHPMRQPDGSLHNVCPLVLSDGRVEFQPKLHITPSEQNYWGIRGGGTLNVFHTPKAKVGILVCYDSEFPEAARHLADEGAEIVFVPYCTDDRQGYSRVRVCCQARAVENQFYVVTAGIVGNLPSVAAMDIHYGRAAVFTPSDFEFARDGIQAEADGNVEMLLVTDLDINDLYRCRSSGSVRPRMDRRPDLFEYRSRFSKKPEMTEHAVTFDPVDDAGLLKT